MISVVIPTYNNEQLLFAHLWAYRNQSLSPEYWEVIVVNDGGRDISRTVTSIHENIGYIHLEENGGPAKARNIGAKQAHGERVLFVGDDCFPSRDLLLHHALHHRRHPHVALQGYSPFHPDIMDTRFMKWLDASGMQASWASLREGGKWRYECDGFLLTTNWSMHRGDFLRNGGFPEDFPSAAWEDVCFGHTLRRSGYKTVFSPQAMNVHYHKHTVDSFIMRELREGRNRIALATLYPEFASSLLRPEDLRGSSQAPLEELVAEAKRLLPIQQANIDELLKTVMLGYAYRGAKQEIQRLGGVLLALEFVTAEEFPAYIFSARRAILQGNDGFVRHCMGWALQKEPDNWATHAFIGECSLAIGEKADALFAFKTALEKIEPANRWQNTWVLERYTGLKEAADGKEN